MASPLDLENLDYVHLIPYNGSGPTGGDSLTEDLNIWYEVRHFQIRSAQISRVPMVRLLTKRPRLVTLDG